MRLALYFTGLALALSLPLQAADKITLRLGDVKGDRYAALNASGELKDLPYDLKLTAFDSGAPVQEALNAGALDLGFTGDLPFLFVYAAGAPVKAVGAWQNNPDSIALLTRPDAGVHALQDLRGKQIAVNRGGWGHYLILGLLERAGLKPEDVPLRFLGPVDGRAALTSGAVAAWAPWEPYIATSTRIDGTVRVPNGGGRGILSGYSYVLAHKEVLQDPARRRAVVDLLTRLAKAQVWAQQHPQAFARALSESLNMPDSITRSWIESARIRPLLFNETLIPTLQRSADFFHRYQVLPKRVDVSEAFDFSLAAGANQIAQQQEIKP